MKLLIYGIDGGDLEVLKKFPMPFTKGSHETGAFYMAPDMDGSHRCSTSFRMSQLKDRADICPLWDLFEKKDLPYLIMNVPTTTPVPQVKKGIVIGSAGGGLNKIEGIPPELISDDSVLPILEKHEYIVDIRIPSEDYANTKDLLDDLVKMEERRTSCFIDICNEKNLEAGFLVNRGTTIIGYLARSEIESYEAFETMEELMPRHGEKSWAHQKLEEHFAMLDKQIERLVNELKPDHFIITADHGNAPHKFRANVTPFLTEHGYFKQKKSSRLIETLREVKNKIGLGNVSRSIMKKVPTAYDAVSNCDWHKTKAFGSTYIPGIFINDRKRFPGIVSEKEVEALTDEIVEAFNRIDEAERNHMVAVPYRRNFEGAEAHRLPDIKLLNSEGVFFDEAVDSLAYRNPNYGPIPEDLSLVKHAAFTGDKGPHPICLLSKSAGEVVKEEDPKDLTLIYRIAERLLQ
jgi:predicted AlkP superfamily phosphohydrolase/phosphomutase